MSEHDKGYYASRAAEEAELAACCQRSRGPEAHLRSCSVPISSGLRSAIASEDGRGIVG